MATAVLIIHLLVCICLIGLVLLQRSEGGALGMGGGGGSLMSGRGAADALAKMTSVAGGFFLATSLTLTVLSGGASTNGGSSVFDMLPSPAATAPAPATTTPAPAPEETRPDPTEGSVEPSTQLASAEIVAPAPTNATTRAIPLGPSSAAAATPPAPQRTATTPARTPSGGAVVPASATTTRAPATTPARTEAPAPNRSATGTTPASATTTERPLVLPNTSGAVGGINLTDDPAAQTESLQIGNGVEAVRRDQRAGPEQ